MLRSAVRSMLRRGRRVFATAFVCVALVAPVAAQGTTPSQTTPPAMQGFEPVTGVPPSEQLPAGPLVMGAYAFVWVVLIAYIWSVARRLSKVQDEIDRLGAQLSKER